MIAISGNTYPVKDQIKALGGRWDSAQKCWMVPDDKADKAYALVQSAPRKTAGDYRRYNSGGARTGCSCGSREGYSRPTDCAQCRFDQDDN